MYAMRLWSVRHARGLRWLYQACSRFAPKLAPLVRAIGRQRAEAVLHPVERLVKSVMFDCRECGQCVLSATGMACPTNCPKQMRNGPCGGVRADGNCEVRPATRCVWVEATVGARRLAPHPAEYHAPMLPAVDNRRRGSSTWIRVLEGQREVASLPPAGERTVPSVEPGSFERACESGRFVVTVELAPPDSVDPARLVERAEKFRGLVDAINITDGAGGNCHMSSMAASAILAAHGHVPICQVACRDRNRIAIQGDILGAAAQGVRNVLCLTGDDVGRGDHPQARPVFDLDAVSLLHIVRGMCDRGQFASGRKLDEAPGLFIGATANAFVPPFRDRIANLENKIAAGARFIQTQFCFDLARFEEFMIEVRRRQLHRRAHIIAGVGTLSSAKALQWMASHVPGVHIPGTILRRIAAEPDQKQAARRICLEIIRDLAQIEGLAGIHVMGHRNEQTLAEIIAESGLRQRQRASVPHQTRHSLLQAGGQSR